MFVDVNFLKLNFGKLLGPHIFSGICDTVLVKRYNFSQPKNTTI